MVLWRENVAKLYKEVSKLSTPLVENATQKDCSRIAGIVIPLFVQYEYGDYDMPQEVVTELLSLTEGEIKAYLKCYDILSLRVESAVNKRCPTTTSFAQLGR
jgi:hypothetical protein